MGPTIIGYAVAASQPCIFFLTYMLSQSKAKLNKIKYYFFVLYMDSNLLERTTHHTKTKTQFIGRVLKTLLRTIHV